MVMNCACLWAKANRTSDIVKVGTIFNVFSYIEICQVEIRTYHLPDNERMRYVLSHDRGPKIFSYIYILAAMPLEASRGN